MKPEKTRTFSGLSKKHSLFPQRVFHNFQSPFGFFFFSTVFYKNFPFSFLKKITPKREFFHFSTTISTFPHWESFQQWKTLVLWKTLLFSFFLLFAFWGFPLFLQLSCRLPAFLLWIFPLFHFIDLSFALSSYTFCNSRRLAARSKRTFFKRFPSLPLLFSPGQISPLANQPTSQPADQPTGQPSIVYRLSSVVHHPSSDRWAVRR